MDASRKQRDPVAFKSLAELKRFIRPGVELTATVSASGRSSLHPSRKWIWACEMST